MTKHPVVLRVDVYRSLKVLAAERHFYLSDLATYAVAQYLKQFKAMSAEEQKAEVLAAAQFVAQTEALA